MEQGDYADPNTYGEGLRDEEGDDPEGYSVDASAGDNNDAALGNRGTGNKKEKVNPLKAQGNTDGGVIPAHNNDEGED